MCLSALLCVSVLLLAPLVAHAGSINYGAITTRSSDFQAIDAYVASQMEAMHIPGVALGIVHGTEVVHIQGFGVANPAGQPMTAQAPLILGSTSKSFAICHGFRSVRLLPRRRSPSAPARRS